jgi:hypothetical protein
VSVYGDYATAGVRQIFEIATKNASDLLKVAADLSKQKSL